MDIAGIKITPSATKELASTLFGYPAIGIRIAVVGGGCSGYSYSMDFIETLDDIDEDDISSTSDDLLIVIDPHTAAMLSGTTVDYSVSLLSRGFAFINPNAKTTCGCGSSFS